MKDSEQSLSGEYEAVFGAATVALRLSYEFLTTRLTMRPEKQRVTSTMRMARCHSALEERLNYERIMSTVIPAAFNHSIIFRRAIGHARSRAVIFADSRARLAR